MNFPWLHLPGYKTNGEGVHACSLILRLICRFFVRASMDIGNITSYLQPVLNE